MKGKNLHAEPRRASDGRIVLAGVSYLNSRPILDPLERGGYQGRFAVERVVPAEVARMVARTRPRRGSSP